MSFAISVLGSFCCLLLLFDLLLYSKISRLQASLRRVEENEKTYQRLLSSIQRRMGVTESKLLYKQLENLHLSQRLENAERDIKHLLDAAQWADDELQRLNLSADVLRSLFELKPHSMN